MYGIHVHVCVTLHIVFKKGEIGTLSFLLNSYNYGDLTFCTKWELEDIFIVFSTGRKINLISYNIITMHTVQLIIMVIAYSNRR